MSVKEQVIRLVESLPDDVTIDDIMKELYFKARVDGGLHELDQGKGIPHEVVEHRLFSQIAWPQNLPQNIP